MSSQTREHFLNFIKSTRRLEKKEKDILMARLKGATLGKIGRRYKVTGERIRQIENEALAKLRKLYYQLKLFWEKS